MQAKKISIGRSLYLVGGLGVIISFFLPWVSWQNIPINGYYLPAGKFFEISGEHFGLSNPFPQLGFTFYVFWLIPLLAIIAIVRSLAFKKEGWLGLVAGALTLCLLTIYFLFTRTLTDLGVGTNVLSMMAIGAWAAFTFAIILILTSFPPSDWLKISSGILIGPLFAWLGFVVVERTVWNQTFSETKGVKADYSLTAEALLHEFEQNDSLANNKYREKMIEVIGTVAATEQLKDSTVNVRFTDSTGSYMIFSFDKEQYKESSKIKAGDRIVAKGSCSGSFYSEILGTTSINFKRSILNKQ